MLTSLNRPGGAVAQLGARLDGIEEVVGSNPIGSTNIKWSGPETLQNVPATQVTLSIQADSDPIHLHR